MTPSLLMVLLALLLLCVVASVGADESSNNETTAMPSATPAPSSSQPSRRPSGAPSGRPTVLPRPTAMPTKQWEAWVYFPTALPSQRPTYTSRPSLQPSAEPSHEPSTPPTPAPTEYKSSNIVAQVLSNRESVVKVSVVLGLAAFPMLGFLAYKIHTCLAEPVVQASSLPQSSSQQGLAALQCSSPGGACNDNSSIHSTTSESALVPSEQGSSSFRFEHATDV